jgi:polar amino acid transport system substrate-binding protein
MGSTPAFLRRRLVIAALATAAWLAGCVHAPAVDPGVRSALAPTGTLRVAVYEGSPSSLVKRPDGTSAGVAYELGQALGRQLGVTVNVVTFQRAAQVFEALRDGQADFTVTNASPARAREIDFPDRLLRVELGYLVGPASRALAASELDQPGVRIGVLQGSTSLGTLPSLLKHAKVAVLPSLPVALSQLGSGGIEAYATNKAILYEMADQMPGARVLDGSWGYENHAVAVPKGRERAIPYLRDFVRAQRESGELKRIVDRAGLRGVARD